MPKKKLLIVSSSLLTDRILLFSSFYEDIDKSVVDVEAWTTSYPQNKEIWREMGYESKPFPKIYNFRERLNYLRHINRMAWAKKLNTISILSMRKFDRERQGKKMLSKVLAYSHVFFGYIISRLGVHQLFEQLVLKKLQSASRSPEAAVRLMELSPDLVLITNPFWVHESGIAIEAAKLGIPVFSFIPSWDNITTKGRLTFRSKAFAVWSDIRKEEMKEYYPSFSNAPIYSVGAPQFDVFFDAVYREPKEIFFARHGLDLSLPLIVYALGSPHFIKSEWGTAISVLNQLKDTAKLERVQVLIRPHPNKHNHELTQEFKMIHRNVKVQEVGNAGMETEKRSQSKNDIIDWVSTFRYSDVIINLSSTVLLDAAVAGKPVININFDDTAEGYFDSFIKLINKDWPHLKPVFQSGAVPLASSVAEVLYFIDYYLENPMDGIEKRDFMRHLICNNEDGKSGLRLGKAVSDLLI